MAKKISFENELILHLLTQSHLKTLFDLKCVGSEIQLHRLRLDNLAFDEKTNGFVIIEYKNRFNADVLNQAQCYHDLILENKEFFLIRLENCENVDFEKTRIMVIGPEFSDKQIKNAKSNFELWQVSLYEDCHVEYKNLKTNEIKTLNIQKEELKLTEEDLLKNKSDEVRDLYHELKSRIKIEDVKCKILIDEISFKTSSKLVCNVRFMKNSLSAYFFTKEITDEKNRLRDISDKGTGGNANYELKIKSKDDLDYFEKMFKQVYTQKVNK